MKQVVHWRLLWQMLRLLLVVGVLITMAEPLKSQSTEKIAKFFCSQYSPVDTENFLSNLNTTISNLRQQLSIGRFAASRTLSNGVSVWGLAWCRGYVSIPDCLVCFNDAVAQLKACRTGTGGQCYYNDCQIRYENYNFYNDVTLERRVVCVNMTSPMPTNFRRTAERLISDLQTAASRTSEFYAASMRKETGGNDTVYGIAQCHLNLSEKSCVQCLKWGSKSLYQCLPRTSAWAIDNGCFMRYSRTPFFGKNQTTDITSLLWDGDLYTKKSIIGGLAGGVSLLILTLAFLLWRRKTKNDGRGQRDISTGSTELLQGPARYSYNDLKLATDNFSDNTKLGGVFGKVYKGTVKNGSAVVIKKTSMASIRGKTHFSNELKIISNVHHRHLLRVLGYCIKGTELFLVHEYMENGSVDHFLFGENKRTLNWKQRFGIIYGTARGLAYLHEQYHVTIIHTNIRASNILLDSEFEPKIADFGLIRLLPEDKTHLSTKGPGSLNSGYLAPEYAIHGRLSEKVDTYSFGLLVLEIISGKRYMDFIVDQSVTQNLLDHAWDLYESGTHLKLVDEKLDPSEYAAEHVEEIIKIALMCTQLPTARPAMSEVVMLLSEKAHPDIPSVRSTILDDKVEIKAATLESLASNSIASTFQLSGSSIFYS